MLKSEQLDLYFVMGTVNCVNEQSPLEVLEDALQAGITMFQLREKGEGALVGEALASYAAACQRLCQKYGVPFIINDDVALARKLGADGVHIGQEDEGLSAVRKELPHALIGVSVHTLEEMEQAVAGGADYVGIGPLYQTRSKEDAKPPVGPAFIRKVRAKYPYFPIVAIGGITVLSSAEVRAAGADGVAVISELCQSKDRAETVMTLKRSKAV